MKKIYLNCLFQFTLILFVKAQSSEKYINRYHCLQGIWQGDRQTKEPFADITKEFILFKNQSFLDFDLDDTSHSVCKFYFQNIGAWSSAVSVNLDSIQTPSVLAFDKKESTLEKGYYFSQIDESNLLKRKFYYDIWPFFGCNETTLYYFYSEYKRISTLSPRAIKRLLAYSKKDKRDYLKEFLDKTFKVIVANKAFLHTLPNDSSKRYLLKGDAVEIVAEKENWYKISYYGTKKVNGWILKSAVGKEFIETAFEAHE